MSPELSYTDLMFEVKDLQEQLATVKSALLKAQNDALVMASVIEVLSERYRVRTIHNSGVGRNERFEVLGETMRRIHVAFEEHGIMYLPPSLIGKEKTI